MGSILQTIIDILFPPSDDVKIIRALSTEEVLAHEHLASREGIVILSRFGDPSIVALIHEAKFHNNKKAITLLSELLKKYFEEQHLHKDTLIIPIPLFRARERERGYNQVSEILCATIKKDAFTLNMNEKVLTRIKNTTPQTTLSREKRLKNMKGAFAVRKGGDVAGKHILLIDDVVTTGATLNEAKATLLPRQPASITCVAIAG